MDTVTLTASMEPNQSLFRVMKTEAEKVETIAHNVLVMLSNRIYVNRAGSKLPLLDLDSARSQLEDKGDYTFTISTSNGDAYAFKIVFQRITTIGKQSVISEFFKEYAQHKRIIIAKDFNNKIADYVTKHHTQIFREASLLSNLIDYRDQPRFEVLSPIETEQFMSDYNTNEYTTKKMLRSDPVAKYYDLRKGQVVRIIRPSPTSGLAVDYRIVT